MILIPIGLDRTEVRRQPWVSYGLIAANVAVFLILLIQGAASDAPARIQGQMRKVGEYLVEHPYLEVPERLAPYLGPGDREALGRLRSGYAERATPPVASVVAAEQERLEALAADLVAAIRQQPIARFGFVPAEPDVGALFTSMFVHVGFWHLLGNMAFLFATGPFLEDVFGRLLFAVLYFSSGVAAAVVHTWHHPDMIPIVGASGAIAGVLGAFLVRLGRSKIEFLWLPIPIFFWWRRRVFIPAFLFLPLWFVGQFWLATATSSGGGVAFWAHVGGFVFGLAAALLVAVTGLEKRFIHPAIEAQVSFSQNPGLVHAVELAGGGRVAEARASVGRVLASEPSNVDARRLAYDLAVDSQDEQGIAEQGARLLDLYLAAGETPLAREIALDASERARTALPARFLARAGEFFLRDGDAREALSLFNDLLRRFPEDPASLRAALRVAEIRARNGERNAALEALARAESHASCTEEWRRRISEKRAQVLAAEGRTGNR
jgi:membrane associated rhomboid family serine protease